MVKWLILGLFIGTMISAVHVPHSKKENHELSILLSLAAVDEVSAMESLSDLTQVKRVTKEELGIESERVQSAKVEKCIQENLLYQCTLKVLLRD